MGDNRKPRLFGARELITCASCGRTDRPNSGFGKCNGCYKREHWRPARGPAVRREDSASVLRITGSPAGSHPHRARLCKVCGKFKSRPSSVCGWCGDDPVTHNGDPYEYDRAHGWD